MLDAMLGALPNAMHKHDAARNARTYGRTDEDFGDGRDGSFRSVMRAEASILLGFGSTSSAKPLLGGAA